MKMRVLLADDQVSLRSALRLFLEHEPNVEVVGEVGDSRALLESTTSLRPDLVMFDWTLPPLKTAHGRRQLTDALRAILPQIYLIGLGGAHDPSHQQSAAGVDAFVTKADAPAHLRAALRQAQATGR
jgi:DNA-binding NarL/FixJ family response regulator